MGSGKYPLAGAVVFSSEGGLARAHLPDRPEPIILGDVETVTYLMRDFLAQREVGERLERFDAKNGGHDPKGAAG